jgi:CheY-like chemotaxis protein
MKTILVVDDEYALAEILAELLQSEGYRVVSATNGKDGLARLKTENPDLILTDLMMPIVDGRELVRSARALPQFASTPVILMSASTKAVAMADASLGIAAFVRKPFQWEDLLATIVRLIGEGDRSRPEP